MGSGASSRAKSPELVTSVDVKLTREEKERFVSELREQILRERQQSTTPRVCYYSVETQTEDQEFGGSINKRQLVATSIETQTEAYFERRCYSAGIDDSDYQSDSDEEEPVQLINDDIDYEFLKKIALQKYESVESDTGEDEEDDLYIQCIEEDDTDDEVSSEEVPKFQPNLAEFPSHMTLRQENARYWNWREKYSVTSFNSEAPLPPKEYKKDIFEASKFTALDKHAIEAPRDLFNKPVAEVVNYLTINCSTELEKSRVIFRWCVAQDLAQLSENAIEDTVLQRLINIHKGKGSYGKLYCDMLSLAHVENKHLQGAVKTSKHQLGDDIDDKRHVNDWTAVKIDNVWRLVDLNFAARGQTGGSHGEWELIDNNGKGYTKVDDAPIGLTYSVDEFYFLTDPEEFIYNHYPHDSEWQMLARTISKEEFTDMANLTSTFFELDLDVRAARRCVIHAQSGEIIIKLGVPKFSQRKFMYRLWKSSKDGVTDDSIKDKKLSQFVFMEQRGQILICKATFPLTGKYKFQLFGQDSSDTSENSSSYSCLTDYLIYCTKEKDIFSAMPSNERQEWGPGYDITKLGIHPITHAGGVIETDDGHLEIKFDMQQPVQLLAKLRDEGGNNMDECVIHRTENGEATINLRIQKKGTYALDIFAKPEGQEGAHQHVCTYLVNSADGVFDKLLFPVTPNQKAGDKDSSKEYTLVPVSHKESYFTSAEGHESIIFDYSIALAFMAEMFLQSVDGVAEIQNHVFIQQKQNRVIFKTRFPKTGIYLLNIFAKHKGSQGSYANVYTYIVYVPKPMKGCFPFPKMFSLWGEGCEIEGLEEGALESGKEIEVTAKVPNAKKVAVLGGGDWTHLEQTSDGVWTGKVLVGEAGQNTRLSACYEEETTEYSALLEYEMKTHFNAELEEAINSFTRLCTAVQRVDDNSYIHEDIKFDKVQIDYRKTPEKVIAKEQIVALTEERNKEANLEEERMKKEEEMKKKKDEEFKRIKQELEEAINSRDITRLHAAVELVEDNAYIQRLKAQYNTAKNMITSLERIKNLQRSILKMDRPAMAEIRSFAQPPKAVHQVMIAAMLLLGENESATKDWKKCQALGKALKTNVKQFQVHDLHPEIAARSKAILKKFRLEDVVDASLGAACFYAWTIGMSEELNILKKNSVVRARPAHITRQQEIFNQKL